LRPNPDFLRHAFQRFGIARREHDVAADRRQLERDAATDAAACAGNQCDLAGKLFHVAAHRWFNQP
jgi:hypothetical protein